MNLIFFLEADNGHYNSAAAIAYEDEWEKLAAMIKEYRDLYAIHPERKNCDKSSSTYYLDLSRETMEKQKRCAAWRGRPQHWEIFSEIFNRGSGYGAYSETKDGLTEYTRDNITIEWTPAEQVKFVVKYQPTQQ